MKKQSSAKKETIIKDYKGNVTKVSCLACARERGEVSAGNICKSKYFDVHQDFEIPIPGFLIVSSRRHLLSIDEFSKAERADFIDFMCKVRSAQRKALGIQVIYLIQEEDTSHHFHVWMFPRYAWMEKKFGRKIQSVRPIMEYAREKMKTRANIAMVEAARKKIMQKLGK